MKTVLYLRVSTKEQDAAYQERVLREFAEDRGLDVVALYQDSVSGKVKNRPGLISAMTAARNGECEAILVWRFDRLSRNAQHINDLWRELQQLGVFLISATEPLDLSTSEGRATLRVIASVAELESRITSQRISAGLTHAKIHGTKSGKPIGRPRLIFDENQVYSLRDSGLSIEKISQQTALSVGTVVRTLQKAHHTTA